MNNIAHIRLASHQLSGTHCQTPESVVAWMGAMQAQDYNMAKWAIGVRLPGYMDKQVEDAFNQGKILRTHVLRPTWHLVSPENIRWMLSLTAEKIKSSSRSRDRELEITEELYGQSNRIIQKALEGGQHLTREAIGEVLEKHKITVNSARLVHFLMRAEVEGIVCSGALQGKKQTYALLDERAPSVPVLHKEEALAKLAKLYFQSHQPATLQDFVWWSGLSTTEARQGLEAVKSGLVAEEINGQTYWLQNDFREIPVAENFCCLLPAFDEYIIAYRDRSAALLSEHYSKVVSSNGMFQPVIVVDGQVVGLWKKSASKKNPVLFDFFEQPDANVMRQNHNILIKYL
ncbi:hypothetical protein FACS189421_12280 [Bacteroidia bacterium]|nr:hypothetical protein FACS189421_12280 [Bacteroidia bacterium]GHT05457.1 hypothetical protein FACS189423_09630 [Bacteroidia bacterium]GHT51176.1 hypothetical protein FACS189440_19830 [Bacteroidia bacterium]